MPQAAPAKGKSTGPGASGSAGKKPKSAKDLNGRQKAAIFLITLGSEISAEIFSYNFV